MTFHERVRDNSWASRAGKTFRLLLVAMDQSGKRFAARMPTGQQRLGADACGRGHKILRGNLWDQGSEICRKSETAAELSLGRGHEISFWEKSLSALGGLFWLWGNLYAPLFTWPWRWLGHPSRSSRRCRLPARTQ
jgi:hypothetical protein